MISKTMQSAINNHVQEELGAFYLYLSMAAFCQGRNLKGFAHWLKLQSQEEFGHANKLAEHLLERGGEVSYGTIKAPPNTFTSITAMVQAILASEQRVSGLINKLYETALKEKDYPAQVLLQWFISEQVEEEASVSEILEKLKLISEKSSSLLYLDKELGKRTA